jgi:hypothetical protein
VAVGLRQLSDVRQRWRLGAAVAGQLPPPGWTLTSVTASGQKDEPGTRDYWYYVAYAKDACGNVSPVSNETGGTLNYHLGDVSDNVTPGQGDNSVSTADVSLLGAHYGLSGGALAGFEYLDVGPTTDNTTNGRPTTDSKTQFEDLVMFALNYTPAVSLVAKHPLPSIHAADLLTIEAPGDVTKGSTFDVRLSIEGGGDLQALSIALGWDAKVVEPIGVSAGDFVTSRNGVVLSPGPGGVDAALMGAGNVMAGQGEVAVVHFRARTDGAAGISVAQLSGRNPANENVTVSVKNVLESWTRSRRPS